MALFPITGRAVRETRKEGGWRGIPHAGQAGVFPQAFLTRRVAIPFMQHVLIIHEVADYEAWKKVFDSAAGIRREAGERSYQVLRYDNDPRKIVHFSTWTSHAAARAFFDSPRLAQIRKEAGVTAPAFIYLEQLEAGIL